VQKPVRHALATGEVTELVVPATNRRGRSIECRLTVSPLRQGDQSVSGAILLMEEVVAGEPSAGTRVS
jgi:two-component system CheB/CheR fusion protein